MTKTLIPGSTVIVVNDGQHRWHADRENFLAALAQQGWTQFSHRTYREPVRDDDQSAYADLCNAVERLDPDWIDETEGGYFEIRPDLGDGVWQLS